MNAFPRIDKRDSFQLTKRTVAAAGPRAKLLISHPADGLTWNIDGPDQVRGFYHLSAEILLGYSTENETVEYTRFNLLIPESDFQRIQ